MNTNERGIRLLHEFEGLRLNAYLCPAKVWTIGWGNTRYEDGSPVKQGDVITRQRAEALFLNILRKFEVQVRRLIKVKLNDNQFSALVSFAYNLGVGNLQKSTLLRKLNANPNDSTIRDEFMRWTRAGGKVLNGLVRRRQAESDLYFAR